MYINGFSYSFVRRSFEGKRNDGGYEADQKRPCEQALKTYTLDPTYGSFEEDIKGSIDVGKLANFVVLDRDLMQVSSEQILRTQVLYTIIGGEVVFEGEE